MRSGNEHGRPVVVAAALIGSAVLFALGTGLQPVWWLTWWAPLPVLLIAPRVSAVRAASVAAAAHLLGMAGFAHYLLAGLAMPVPKSVCDPSGGPASWPHTDICSHTPTAVGV